ncbi:MAG: hypothetical protein NVSMB25_04210 [Thermoleophilaceae bacterium]
MELADGLRRHFGFGAFRPGQREACEAALAGRDVLVVMPTGSGKSLCYQLPALLRDELTIVVSPLVALMADQTQALAARGLGDRVRLVSSQHDRAANSAAVDDSVHGDVRLLYVSPERFSSPGFIDRIGQARVGLFVVDEAHCVSQWGHDFRPDYFQLAGFARQIGARSILASTATATPRVAADIERRLGLREPLRVATGFDRPNLAFTVARPRPGDKLALIRTALSRADALPAIVYTGTRASAEELAEGLAVELGEPALAYHAGLERDRRGAAQRSFLTDEVRIIVATNAFGMGIDKPNVRSVIHANVPASLEAYYQEAGRAGRDGAPARALLIAENRDKALHVHFIKRDELDERLPGRLAAALGTAGDDGTLPGLAAMHFALDVEGLCRRLGCDADQLRALIGHLARAGVVSPQPAPTDRVAGTLVREFDGRAIALTRSSMREAAQSRWQQYRSVWAYVEGEGCRRRRILEHFGDAREPSGGEGCCDICDAGIAAVVPAPDPVQIASLDDAIAAVARAARPAVGRTTCAEILHGARTKKVERNAYDRLDGYASFARMRRAAILARIDELIDEGRLTTTGGPYPVLAVPPVRLAAA